MARGAAAKLRRRTKRKEEQETTDRIFASTEEEEENGTHDFGPSDIPLPPGMSANVKDDDDSDDDDEKEGKEEEENVVKKKKKNKSKSGAMGGIPTGPIKKKPQAGGGIKSTPLILLIIMTGSTLLPALIFASDYLGNFFQKHHVFGQIGYRLGMGSVPRKRVLSFYEKHDPNKIEDVPDILSKYYGDYPTLIKKLERKYQDYGYFLGWEQDEAPLTLAIEQLHETYSVWINSYWNVYAPQPLKTAARNIRYNVTFLHKKFHKAWKKHIWPVLEPFLGVPKGTEKQKRQDAAEARKRKKPGSSSSSAGTRRRSAEFRDDVEEE